MRFNILMDKPSQQQEDEDILCNMLATNSSSTKVKVKLWINRIMEFAKYQGDDKIRNDSFPYFDSLSRKNIWPLWNFIVCNNYSAFLVFLTVKLLFRYNFFIALAVIAIMIFLDLDLEVLSLQMRLYPSCFDEYNYLWD